MGTIIYLSAEGLTGLQVGKLIKQLKGGTWTIEKDGARAWQSGSIEREGAVLYVNAPSAIESMFYTEADLEKFSNAIGAPPVTAVAIDVSSRFPGSYELAREIGIELSERFGGCIDWNNAMEESE